MEKGELTEVLQTFAEISGQKITLTDRKFRAIVDSGGDFWEFCGEIHRSKKCLYRCLKSDITNFRKAEELRGVNIYTCPFGMVSAIAPIFDGDFLKGYLIVCPGKGRPSTEEILATVEELAPELEREVLKEALGRVPECDAGWARRLGHMMEIFAQYIGDNGVIQSASTLAQVTRDFVDKNYEKKITLAQLSMNLHYSTVSLTEHFRREYGETIMQYVLRRRVELAQKLMRETGDPLHEISERCGFDDVEYFSRCFKKRMGVSPAQWRKNQKGRE